MLIMQSIPSTAATVAVDKATSELLSAPDWTLNINICDALNSNPRQRKDFLKALKRRLLHKNSKVQLLALTLLETMVKNCGDFVHYQIDEREVLREMTKIVKKKGDVRVRDRILGLLESWQEEFGGHMGEHPQYYWACQELKRSGVSFPERAPSAAPVLTPQANKRVDETIPTHIENLSLSSLDSIMDAMDLLGDMLQAVNPRDRTAVKDEVIIDLVNQCRSNQKKLMQTLTNTGDEKLLSRGLELNDALQTLLAKHDAISSGSPLTIQVTGSVSSKPTEAITIGKSNEAKNSSPPSNISPPASVAIVTSSLIEEHEEDFAQLTRRHSSRYSPSTSAGTKGCLVPVTDTTAPTSYDPTDDLCKALALPYSDSSAQVHNTKEQELIDVLSLTLSTSTSPPHTPHSSPSEFHQNMHHRVQVPQGALPYDSYIVPWAHQPQVQPQYQPQNHSNSLFLGQPQFQYQTQTQPLLQPQYPPSTSGYPLPKWANTPGYFTGANNNANPMIGSNSEVWGPPVLAENPYIPPYRLFEDLNVLGNGDGRLKMKSTASSSTQSMVGGRK